MGSAWHMVKSVMLAVIIIISSPVHCALGGVECVGRRR